MLTHGKTTQYQVATYLDEQIQTLRQSSGARAAVASDVGRETTQLYLLVFVLSIGRLIGRNSEPRDACYYLELVAYLLSASLGTSSKIGQCVQLARIRISIELTLVQQLLILTLVFLILLLPLHFPRVEVQCVQANLVLVVHAGTRRLTCGRSFSSTGSRSNKHDAISAQSLSCLLPAPILSASSHLLVTRPRQEWQRYLSSSAGAACAPGQIRRSFMMSPAEAAGAADSPRRCTHTGVQARRTACHSAPAPGVTLAAAARGIVVGTAMALQHSQPARQHSQQPAATQPPLELADL